MRKMSLILFVLLAIGGCASEQTRLARAQELFYVQDYNSAYKKLYPLARAGNPKAQYAMGYLYYYGKGVIENDVMAKQWFRLAAQQGELNAIKALQMLPRGNSASRHG